MFGILWSLLGAEFLVHGALGLSRASGLSPWILGITVVALATSLPDIAAAYHATRRGYADFVLGEGIGAAVVTTLLTLGMLAIVNPGPVDTTLLLPVLVATVLSSFLLLSLMLGGWRITSRARVVLVASYFAMVLFNVVWFHNGHA
ncbi:MAG TPA: hypothetical protein VI999_03235 [Thermoplasmata archaeon]|nr:hypothetical protein [Thermoplasmata archaeon]